MARDLSQRLGTALDIDPIIVPYIEEPQGEAVAWAPDARGYYTVSEEPGGTPARLYFYPRIDDPLPVELSSFTARLTNNKVSLEWSTETEVNNYGFDVERSSFSITPSQDDWLKIGFVRGSGNSSSAINYSIIDEDIPNVSMLSYRLKQIDNDGSYDYSDEVLVINSAPSEYALQQNYPNPFNPITKIKYQLSQLSFLTIMVYDILGNEVATLVNEETPAGTFEVKFDATSLPSGIYFYKLHAGTFIEIKKMVLIQ